jgi:hypothetical protein
MEDQRTPADLAMAAELMAIDDPETFAAALFVYYRDADRADRTPRSTLYLHLGQLAGMIARLTRVR